MQPLTRRAMAVLCREWLVPAQLVRDLPTMALPLPLDLKLLIGFFIVNTVWRAMFPLILLAMRGVARLVLVALGVAILLAFRHLGVLVGGVAIRC
jgi:hypothetical protein